MYFDVPAPLALLGFEHEQLTPTNIECCSQTWPRMWDALIRYQKNLPAYFEKSPNRFTVHSASLQIVRSQWFAPHCESMENDEICKREREREKI